VSFNIRHLAADHKDEFPPLFPGGLHSVTMVDIRNICVNAFPDSLRRPQIMAGLDAIHLRLLGLEISGEMWVDGSFTTQKQEPDDVDVVVYTAAEYFDKGTQEQQDFLNWLSDDKDKVKALFSCHSAAIAYYPKSRPNMCALYEATRNDYLDKFGHSVTTREEKGICVIPLFVAKARGEGGA